MRISKFRLWWMMIRLNVGVFLAKAGVKLFRLGMALSEKVKEERIL